MIILVVFEFEIVFIFWKEKIDDNIMIKVSNKIVLLINFFVICIIYIFFLNIINDLLCLYWIILFKLI